MTATTASRRVKTDAHAVHAALCTLGADSAERAATDREIAELAAVAVREVIDLCEELTKLDVAVVAECRGRRKGRYITRDPRVIRDYAERLHNRAKAIHGRARSFDDVADRLEARMPVDAGGQGRMFAHAEGESRNAETPTAERQSTIRNPKSAMECAS